MQWTRSNKNAGLGKSHGAYGIIKKRDIIEDELPMAAADRFQNTPD